MIVYDAEPIHGHLGNGWVCILPPDHDGACDVTRRVGYKVVPSSKPGVQGRGDVGASTEPAEG